MICEYCGEHHEGQYGSGRFCTGKCARGFSTQAKRNLINKKVSKTLTGTGHADIEVTCEVCKTTRVVPWRKRHGRTCGPACAGKLPDVREKLSKTRIAAIKAGKYNGSGIKCAYLFKEENIKCDSKLEYACLNYFETKMHAAHMRRCDEVIEYIVECKSFTGQRLNEKWRNYNERADLKKSALEQYAKKTGRKSFWFTPNTHRSFYRSVKVTPC